MKSAEFVLHTPTSVEEAVRILSQVADEDGRIVAGGQTLVPAMALRFARPGHLVDINNVPELARLDVEADALRIGACVRHAAFQRPVTEGPLGALLSQVVRSVAHLPIRNRGTFCGSLANADAASEWCLVAATLGATVLVRSARGERQVAIEDFLLGYMTTALEPDEMIEAVRLPLLPTGARFGFIEFSRRAGDFAQAMALVVLESEGSTIARARVGVGGVEAVARRLAEAEAALAGRIMAEEAFVACADAAAAAVEPVEDDKDGVAYKRDLVRAGVLRALKQAAGEHHQKTREPKQ